VTDPLAPTILGGMTLPGGSTDIALSGSSAFLINDYSLHVVDIHEPAAPTNLGGLCVTDYAWGVGAGEGLVLVANGTLGMKIFEDECGASMDVQDSAMLPRGSRAVAAPNPGTDGTSVQFDLGREGSVHAVVHDITGRTVRDLGERNMSIGRQRVSWDGRDNAGHRVPPGVYMIRITTPGAARTSQVAGIARTTWTTRIVMLP
jgi:hypothetical protein